MKIITAQDKSVWNNFLIKNDGSFLQSWDWGNFQESVGKRIWRFIIIGRQDDIISEVQIIRENLPAGKTILYIPYGPCFSQSIFLKVKKNILLLIFKQSKIIAKKENSIFLKMEPYSFLPKVGDLIKIKKRVQPKKSWVLSLSSSEEDIFKNFQNKTRYNIRLAQRKGVEILIAKTIEQKYDLLSSFWKLTKKTSERGKFKPHSKNYYKNLIKMDNVILYAANYNGKSAAINIILYFGKQAVYLHGASDYKYRHAMAPFLLQWRQICDAKEAGIDFYDFGGVDEEKWPGVTRFKQKFGGKEIEYPMTKIYVFQKIWYAAYSVLSKFV
jgi:lipid II:glycine glycyltransferase (peptidoglycan interpeptide bridge formation enzyme)